MIQITADHFCAAVTVQNNKVVSTAPILRWMIDWDVEKVLWWCNKKKWKYEFI